MMLGLTGMANAILMSGTFTATIYEISGSLANDIWDLGEVINWNILYDDQGEWQSTYTDGANGIAENGKGDDVLQSRSKPIGHLFATDATYTFDNKTLEFIDALNDTTARNFSQITCLSDPNLLNGYVLMDGFYMYTAMVSSPGTKQMFGTILDSPTAANRMKFDINSFETHAAAPVPEPATILFMGTGLAGLIVARRRKKA